MRSVFYLLLFLASFSQAISQEVLISKDINIRQDLKYLLLGQIGENILLFRDRDNRQMVEVFDENLKYKYDRDISIEQGRSRIFAVMPHENDFSIIYGINDKDTLRVRQKVIDDRGELVDSLQLSAFSRKELTGRFKYSYSENNNKMILFTSPKRDEVFMAMYDLNEREETWNTWLKLIEAGNNIEMEDVVVSNNEDVFFLYEKGNSRYEKKDHAFHLYHIAQGANQVPVMYNYSEQLSKDVHLTIDEANQNLLLIGLFTGANRSSALGYYFVKNSFSSLSANANIETTPFSDKFIEEVYGNQRKVNKALDYFFIKDVVFKQNGGFIWVGEMYKEYFRRSSNPYGRYSRGYGDRSGFVDYYNEDMIIFSMDSRGDEEWAKVLYKKQFSQDDQAMYSSFFAMKTPSRIRLLYNDEIKRSNTVSEYLLDPLGNTQRKTVLNTEYENLRLQFVEAIQTSSSSLVVPSLNTSILNLVKINY